MFEIKWAILALALVMYLLVIIFQDKKVWFTTGAAIITTILGFIFTGHVFAEQNSFAALCYHIFFELINWNVLMIYVG